MSFSSANLDKGRSLRRAREPYQRGEVIERLHRLWSAHPELRLGQLIQNLGEDIYYIEDFDLIDMMEALYASYARRSPEAISNSQSPKPATDNDAKSVVGGGEDGAV